MRKLTVEEKERCKISMAQNLHDYMLSNRDEWLILGDETGRLPEFEGGNPHRRSRMMWIAIPPDITLPPLHPLYHGQDAEWFEEETIKALKYLNRTEEVGCFIFSYQSGQLPKNTDSKIVNKAHLLMWQFTLPLVLEWVAANSQGNQNVSIYIERVDTLDPGEMPLAPLMQEFVDGLQERESWAKLSFKRHLIIAKEPLEYLWLGYTDALGHIFNDDIPPEELELFHSMRNKVISVPYRQSNLNSTIRQLLKDSSRPLFFLQSLYSIEANDLRDYIRPFFGNAIKESLDSLDVDEWQDLLEHIDKNSRDKKGQRVTALIHDYVDIDKSLERLKNSRNVQFDLLRMMLGTSNHRGAMAEGLRCKQICENMFDSGFEPTYEKLRKFENISSGLEDNMFNFNLENIEIPEYDNKMTEQDIRKLGTIAQSLGLSGTENNLDIAIQIESNLANHGDNRYHKARHSILLAELLVDKKEHSKAKEILDRLQYDNQNSFLFVTQLKCCSLGEFELPTNEKYVDDFMKLLDDDHPSQRIAYWYARWALLNNKESDEITQNCISHLLSLTDVPLFSHDAPGVILACELMDLESRGYELNFDTTEFYEMVKLNSQPSTLKWLEEHPPNENDWLAPLNFNYR